MALIDNLKARAAPKPPTPADIAAKLQAAETALAELEAKRDAASLDALIDAPGASNDLAKLNAATATAREQIATLQAAQRAAVAREQEVNREIRRGAIRHAQSRVKAKLKERDEAAATFSEAIQNAAEAYQKMLAADDAARNHWQIANIGDYPQIALDDSGANQRTLDDIRRVCAGDMWRHTPTKKGQVFFELALPGASSPKVEYQHWPEGVPSLKDAFEANSAAILAAMAPKVPA